MGMKQCIVQKGFIHLIKNEITDEDLNYFKEKYGDDCQVVELTNEEINDVLVSFIEKNGYSAIKLN